jgi:Arc/MetJ-type ribon-helix-helix transcriptional regulator
MPRQGWITVAIPRDIIERVKRVVKGSEGRYRTAAHFIRQALSEAIVKEEWSESKGRRVPTDAAELFFLVNKFVSNPLKFMYEMEEAMPSINKLIASYREQLADESTDDLIKRRIEAILPRFEQAREMYLQRRERLRSRRENLYAHVALKSY